MVARIKYYLQDALNRVRDTSAANALVCRRAWLRVGAAPGEELPVTANLPVYCPVGYCIYATHLSIYSRDAALQAFGIFITSMMAYDRNVR
jgi:hypothetical protein